MKTGRGNRASPRRSSQAGRSGSAAVPSRISRFSPSNCPARTSSSWPMRPAAGAWSGQTWLRRSPGISADWPRCSSLPWCHGTPSTAVPSFKEHRSSAPGQCRSWPSSSREGRPAGNLAGARYQSLAVISKPVMTEIARACAPGAIPPRYLPRSTPFLPFGVSPGSGAMARMVAGLRYRATMATMAACRLRERPAASPLPSWLSGKLRAQGQSGAPAMPCRATCSPATSKTSSPTWRTRTTLATPSAPTAATWSPSPPICDGEIAVLTAAPVRAFLGQIAG